MKKIEATYLKIVSSDIFKVNGRKIDLPKELMNLANLIHSHKGEVDWELSNDMEASLDDIIIAGFWLCSEWNSGQESDAYAAYCALGQVFTPSYSCPPSEDESAFTAYEMMGQWFKHSRLPTIREIRSAVIFAKTCINRVDARRGELPSIDITLGYTDCNGNWAAQLGDNSFTGAAYNHRIWAVATVYLKSNSTRVAADLIQQIRSAIG